MSTVVIDAATRAKLLAAGSLVEFRDEAGKLVGRFARVECPSQYAAAEVEQMLRDMQKKGSE